MSSNSPWSDYTNEKIIQDFCTTEGATVHERTVALASKLGCTSDALRNLMKRRGLSKLASLIVSGATLNPEVLHVIENSGLSSAKIADLRAENSQLQLALEAAQEKKDYWSRTFSQIASTLPTLDLSPRAKQVRANQTQVANLIISDIQGGEIYTKNDTAGVTEYNTDIMLERASIIVQEVLTSVECRRRAAPVDVLLVDILGDLVEGVNIYKKQRNYAEHSVLRQVLLVADMLCQMLQELSPHFETIRVRATPGNHGRISHEHHDIDNFDNLVIWMIESRLAAAGNTNVELLYNINPSSGMLYEIPEMPGFKHYIFHGDIVQSYRQTPHYGLDRKTGALQQYFNTSVHVFKLGHHHRLSKVTLPHGAYYVNGSWPGTSPFACFLGTASIPVQQLLYLQPTRGVCAEEPIYLSSPPQLDKDKNGIYTPYYGDGISLDLLNS